MVTEQKGDSLSRRDDYPFGASQAPAGTTSSSAVRGPQVKSAPVDSGEHSRSPRPKVAPHPTGSQDERQAEPQQGLAVRDLPETYGVDEVEILCKDPWWYFAYWEVTESGLKAAREQLGTSAQEARLILRVFVQNPGSSAGAGAAGAGSHGGTRAKEGRDIRDVPVLTQHGRRYLEAPRPNALLRVAVGLLSPEGFFAPIAHSSVLRVPPQQPSSDTQVEWLHVLPSRTEGRQHERIVKGGTRPAHQERSLPWQSGAAAVAVSAAEAPTNNMINIPGPTQAAGASSEAGPRRNG